ncbi:MAG: DnaA N-terminal domain-containing protein [Myxococcota bacterium]
MTDIWQATLSDLETKVSSHNFQSWFKNIQFHHQEGDTAHLEVADEFFKAWIEENYLDLIEESLQHVAGQNMGVRIGIRGSFDPLDDIPTPAMVAQTLTPRSRSGGAGGRRANGPPKN